MLQSQVWSRRQETPQQWVPAEPALMERVERINMVMVCSNQRTRSTQHNPYTMDIDQGNRNCYNCGGFGHLARNCRNRGTGNRIGEGRRLEYGQDNGQRLRIKRENGQNYLNGERDLIIFDQISVTIDLQCLQEQWIIHLAATLTMETC